MADELAAQTSFCRFWSGNLRRTLGLVKKLETRPGRSAFSGGGGNICSVGAEVDLQNDFHDDIWIESGFFASAACNDKP